MVIIELKQHKSYILLYFIPFYSLWAFKELWLIEYLDMMDSTIAAIITAMLKITVWIVPVFLLVTMVEKKNPITYLRLSSNVKKGLKWAIWVTFLLSIYFIVISIVMDLGIKLDMNLDFWLNSFLFVGLTEEIVFRGYILKKLMTWLTFWRANIVTSLLFVSIHFPIWIHSGLFEFPYVISSIIQVFIIGIGFGYIYRKADSLWSVIIIHSMYDLFVVVFN